MLGRAGAPGIEGRLEARLGIRRLHVEVKFFFSLLSAKGYVGAGSVTGWRCSQLVVVGIFVYLLQIFVSPTETLLLYDSPVAGMRGLGSRIRC